MKNDINKLTTEDLKEQLKRVSIIMNSALEFINKNNLSNEFYDHMKSYDEKISSKQWIFVAIKHNIELNYGTSQTPIHKRNRW